MFPRAEAVFASGWIQTKMEKKKAEGILRVNEKDTVKELTGLC